MSESPEIKKNYKPRATASGWFRMPGPGQG